MVHIEDSVVIDDLLVHIGDQRVRAKLVDKPFELGAVTNKRPSSILEIVEKNKMTFTEIGMSDFKWHDDALRSLLKLGRRTFHLNLSSKIVRS